MNDVLKQMQAKYDANGQRLFWVCEFAGDILVVRRAVDALEAQGSVKWYLEFQCPECNAEWGGHPSVAPSTCRFCGYNWREEEDEDFFEATKFIWSVDPKPSAEDERDTLKARVMALEAEARTQLHERSNDLDAAEAAVSVAKGLRDQRNAVAHRAEAAEARIAELEALLRYPSLRADAAVAAEREACAKLAQDAAFGTDIAAAIRARGGAK